MTNGKAIYVRVASENQNGSTLEHQIANCKEYVKAKFGCEMPLIYSDYGSGMEPNKPGLKKMFEDAEQGKFNVLVMRDLTRLSRHGLHVVQMVKRLVKKFGVKIMLTEDKSVITSRPRKKLQLKK